MASLDSNNRRAKALSFAPPSTIHRGGRRAASRRLASLFLVLGLGFKSRPVRFVVFCVGGVFDSFFLAAWLMFWGAPEQQTGKCASVVFGGLGFNSRIAVLVFLFLFGFACFFFFVLVLGSNPAQCASWCLDQQPEINLRSGCDQPATPLWEPLRNPSGTPAEPAAGPMRNPCGTHAKPRADRGCRPLWLGFRSLT